MLVQHNQHQRTNLSATVCDCVSESNVLVKPSSIVCVCVGVRVFVIDLCICELEFRGIRVAILDNAP